MKFGTASKDAITFAVNSRAILAAASGVSAICTRSGVVTSYLPESERRVIVANCVAYELNGIRKDTEFGRPCVLLKTYLKCIFSVFADSYSCKSQRN